MPASFTSFFLSSEYFTATSVNFDNLIFFLALCRRYDKATWQRDKMFSEEAARETVRAHRMRRLLAAASFISVVEGGDENENDNDNRNRKEEEEEEEEGKRGRGKDDKQVYEKFKMDEILFEDGKGYETQKKRRAPTRRLETDSDRGG